MAGDCGLYAAGHAKPERAGTRTELVQLAGPYRQKRQRTSLLYGIFMGLFMIIIRRPDKISAAGGNGYI